MNKFKIVILVVLAAVVFSCRTKVKTVDKINIEQKEHIKVDSVVEVKNNVEQEVKQTEIKKIVKDELSNSGDVEIKGKSDSIKGFTYHNIQGKDTLQSILITGNADFVIKNKWNNSKVKEDSNIFKESLNKVAEYSRKAVAQETIKDTAIKIKDTNKKVKETGFTFMTGVFIFLFILIVLVGLYFYFKDKISLKQIISKFVK